ncbi:hypothetical protein ECC02_013569 [Trypanosoma cruzi]|uniref:Uncharacterized protein n=1 Tax=Trypanosoma cruzi TaxID=5693 RepID=A0A7J6XH03_TRYCR|nr:hypothetical protein ECC02_013569 [Trypanosoma cruzi]
MAPARTHPSSNVAPRKQLCACHAYECVWGAFNVTDAGSGKEHTAGQRKQVKQNTIISLSCLVHRTTADAHKSPRLSAGTHSPHTILQPRAVYASADTASSSGAHTHAELLRLPSISRRRDGVRVVFVVGAPVVVVVGGSGAVVVVIVVGDFVVVVVVVVVSAEASEFLSACSSDILVSLCVPVVSSVPSSSKITVTSADFCPGPVGACSLPPTVPSPTTGLVFNGLDKPASSFGG